MKSIRLGKRPFPGGVTKFVIIAILALSAISAGLFLADVVKPAYTALAVASGAGIAFLMVRQRRIEWRLLTLDRNMKRRSEQSADVSVHGHATKRPSAQLRRGAKALEDPKGQHGPLGASGKEKLVGRQAAQSPVATPRRELLSKLVDGWNPAVPADATVAGVMLPPGSRRPAPTWLQTLVPGISLPLLEHTRPRAIVIDENALTGGPWFAADSAAGEHLLEELVDIGRWARAHGVPVFGILNPRAIRVNSAVIRSLYDAELPVLAPDESPDGIPIPILIRRVQWLVNGQARTDTRPPELVGS